MAEAIHSYRLYADLTQKELAGIIGCSKTQITRIEAGRYQEIRGNRYAIALRNHIAEQTGILVDTSAIDKYEAQRNSKTGIRGVCYVESRKKYTVTIGLNGIHYNVGRYATIEDATRVRQEAELMAALGDEAFANWFHGLRQSRSG